MKVIGLVNHKGGSAKTASAVNIAAALVMEKKRVLLIDCDPQANASVSLGVDSPEKHIYGVLSDEYPISEAIINIKPNFDIVAAVLDLCGIEVELASKMGREFVLKEKLSEVKDQYDVVIIDSPPSFGIIVSNVFVAADELYVPCQSEYLAVHGLSRLTSVIGEVQKRLNPSLKIGGVFLTRYDQRKVLGRNVRDALKDTFKDKLFKTEIRENIALAEAPSKGLDIFSYAPTSNGATDYKALTKELIKRGKL